MDYTIDIISETGVPFRVVLGVRRHNGYVCNDGRRVVSFYDRRHDFTEYGQFVSDYLPYTVLDHKDFGLNLYGTDKDWRIGLDNLNLVKSWLEMLVNHF